MTLPSMLDQLSAQIKAAMLARDADRLSTLRMLKSALGYLQIERKSEPLTDADFIAMVQREIKKRQDSITQFEQGGRMELAEKEKQEAIILQTFLPIPLTLLELEAMVVATIQTLGATGKKEMGAVIKSVQAQAAGRADGKSISALVGRLLP
ncbi:MAG: GatB/YqeY domain-containing protein [Verrucomicrobia bacterium]|nr:MAG: GatB/YqeY domain-containing protein [Verrucomicrobiota bacterium]